MSLWRFLLTSLVMFLTFQVVVRASAYFWGLDDLAAISLAVVFGSAAGVFMYRLLFGKWPGKWSA